MQKTSPGMFCSNMVVNWWQLVGSRKSWRT